MIDAVRNSFRLPDLRNKLLVTLGLLVIYRLAAHIPAPGVDQNILKQVFASNPLVGLLDMFSGGALSRFSVMSMGVYPYITSSIILQLLVPIIPQLEELSKEGEQGIQKINQYTNWLTIPLALLQGWGQSVLLARAGVLPHFGFSGPDLLPTLTTLISLTAGTAFAMWLGELITSDGIGNGISIIIFGGIVAAMPRRMGQMLAAGNYVGFSVLILVMIITVAVIVFVQEGERRIPVQYAKRVRGRKVYGGQSTYVPLRVNAAGMIPIIFAQSLMILPATLASYFVGSSTPWVASLASTTTAVFNIQGWFYWFAYFWMVVGFTYFYTDVVFRQQNLPETLQRQGGFIPGIRAGKITETYLNKVMSRITLVGALFLAAVAVIPFFVRGFTSTSTMLISSAGLLIVVGVVLDTMKQMEAQLLMRHYEGFIR